MKDAIGNWPKAGSLMLVGTGGKVAEAETPSTIAESVYAYSLD